MVIVSKARPKDCQRIRQFEQRVWKDPGVTSPYDAAFFVRFGYAFIAKDVDKIVGVIIALKTKGDEVKIADWLVDEKYRRRGIGEKLYIALRKNIAHLPIVAFINTTNKASLSAHQKFGFKKIKKLTDPFYLGDKSSWWLVKNG